MIELRGYCSGKSQGRATELWRRVNAERRGAEKETMLPSPPAPLPRWACLYPQVAAESRRVAGQAKPHPQPPPRQQGASVDSLTLRLFCDIARSINKRNYSIATASSTSHPSPDVGGRAGDGGSSPPSPLCCSLSNLWVKLSTVREGSNFLACGSEGYGGGSIVIGYSRKLTIPG